MNYDILIREAQILDGTGGPGYFSDAGIAGGKIAAIGRRLQGAAETVIDGRGLVLCPGFIDAHSHQDMALEHNPACRNDIGQGITTFVGGCAANPLRPWPGRIWRTASGWAAGRWTKKLCRRGGA